eukprot:9476258-Pyramimonas_sp.AAC.1
MFEPPSLPSLLRHTRAHAFDNATLHSWSDSPVIPTPMGNQIMFVSVTLRTHIYIYVYPTCRFDPAHAPPSRLPTVRSARRQEMSKWLAEGASESDDEADIVARALATDAVPGRKQWLKAMHRFAVDIISRIPHPPTPSPHPPSPHHHLYPHPSPEPPSPASSSQSLIHIRCRPATIPPLPFHPPPSDNVPISA